MTEIAAPPAQTTLKPYPAYRDSGVEWLGDVPEHWDTKKLKTLSRSLSGGTPPMNERRYWEREVPWVSPKDMKQACIADASMWISQTAVEDGHTGYVSENAVLMVVRSGILRRKIPIGVTARPVAFNQDLKGYVFRPTEMLAQYVAALIESNDQEFLTLWRKYGATVESLEQPWVDNTWLPLPPLAEQRAIADFLDAMDARITRFIAARKKMIRLMEEKKQAVINQAVTKGLDPDVPMKDSGVDWIGDIPAHWKVRRLKNVVRMPLQYGANESGGAYRDDWPRYVRITDISSDGRLRHETSKSLEPQIAEPYILHQGDVLLARSGATVGKSFIYRRSWGVAGFAGYLIRARLDTRRIAPEFFKRYTESAVYWSWIKSSSIQATIENVSAEKYARLELPLPPSAEQEAIVEYIDRETVRINSIIARSRQEIELMQEYRTRLISDVVTGKLDVRGIDLGEMPSFTEIPDGEESLDPNDDSDGTLDNDLG